MKSVSDLICVFDEFLLTEDLLLTGILSKLASIFEKYQAQHKMDEEEFAEFLDLPLETVNNIDDHCYDPKLSELCKIAVKLDKDLVIDLR